MDPFRLAQVGQVKQAEKLAQEERSRTTAAEMAAQQQLAVFRHIQLAAQAPCRTDSPAALASGKYGNARVAAVAKEMGNRFFKTGEYASAAEKYRQAAEADPTDSSLYTNLSVTFFFQEMWQASLESALIAANLAPYAPKGYYRSGLCYTKLGMHPEAIQAFEIALSKIDIQEEKQRSQILEALNQAQKNIILTPISIVDD
mmetsp:Transcript_21592/g.30010  ORF Transcript_21592/g.30010 Transcript_21592/m.30010 type:complete len:201 (-) Transcript_21592:102-704(-)